MRRLILFRHAKAERGAPELPDRDRALEPNGREDSRKVGAYLAHHGLTPDVALVSPSRRTRETWDCAAAGLAQPPGATFDERLYEATPETIMAVIRDTPADVRSLLVVGHNPGFHDLARLLTASGDVDHRERLNEGLPTGAIVVIDFAIEDWAHLHPRGGRLERFVSPRLLTAATE